MEGGATFASKECNFHQSKFNEEESVWSAQKGCFPSMLFLRTKCAMSATPLLLGTVANSLYIGSQQ